MQLLKTKFHIPGFNVDATVSRERIRRLISDSCSIVVISAPAGFGKTTLLSEWVGNCKTPVAWVSLEKSEDIPGVFWSYLITAVSSVLSGCRKGLPMGILICAVIRCGWMFLRVILRLLIFYPGISLRGIKRLQGLSL
jgi:hypothetical protein